MIINNFLSSKLVVNKDFLTVTDTWSWFIKME